MPPQEGWVATLSPVVSRVPMSCSIWYHPIKACIAVMFQALACLWVISVVGRGETSSMGVALLVLVMSCMSFVSLKVVRSCREDLDSSISGMNEMLESDPNLLSVVGLVLEYSYRMHMQAAGGTPTPSGLRRWSRSKERAVRALVVGVARGLAHGIITQPQGSLIMGDAVSILAGYPQGDALPRQGVKRDSWGS